jgi:hypothetical protein
VIHVRAGQPADRPEWIALRSALWPDENEQAHAAAVDRFFAEPPRLGSMPETVEFASDAVADNAGAAAAHRALGFEEVVVVRCFRKALALCFLLAGSVVAPVRAQDLSAEDVRVGLDSAVHLGKAAATGVVPDLTRYVLYSVTPRSLKGDPGGLHWQVRWRDLAFPHRRELIVRVYMKDGHTVAERTD